MKSLARCVPALLLLAVAGPSPLSAAPVPADSLMVESLRTARLAAPELESLSWLRRQYDYAAKEFGRSVGDNPPFLTAATVLTLPEDRRPSVAMLRVAGYKLVLGAPEDRPRVPPPTTSETAISWTEPASERIALWLLEAYERDKATASPPPGRTRIVPDWMQRALGGLSTLPIEQNHRLAWMREHIDQRIPLETFFEMQRPQPAEKPARSRKGVRPPPTPRLFDAQALSFARFLSRAESDRFIGKVLERTLAGEPQTSAFNIAKNLLPRPDALEQAWVQWVKTGALPDGSGAN